MNSTQLMKFAAGVLLFGAWLALVIIGKAPADHLIDAIALTIAGLGVHGATMSTPGVAVAGLVQSAELQPALPVSAPLTAAESTAPSTAPAAAPVTAQTTAAPQPTLQ